MAWNTPVRLMSIISCQVGSSISATVPKEKIPALASRKSIRPSSARVRATNSLHLVLVAHVGDAGHAAPVLVLDQPHRLVQVGLGCAIG